MKHGFVVRSCTFLDTSAWRLCHRRTISIVSDIINECIVFNKKSDDAFAFSAVLHLPLHKGRGGGMAAR